MYVRILALEKNLCVFMHVCDMCFLFWPSPYYVACTRKEFLQKHSYVPPCESIKRVHAEISMRVLANIASSMTRSHACHVITTHACTRTDNIAPTRVFEAFAFDWVYHIKDIVVYKQKINYAI